MEDKKLSRKEYSLGKDLALSILAVPFGVCMGTLASLINPLTIPNAIRDIRRREITSLNSFVYTVAGAVAYSEGIYRCMNKIIENPREVEAYLPVMTNVLGLVGYGFWKIYHKGKEQGKLEGSLE